jgi:DnaK suppressor protein
VDVFDRAQENDQLFRELALREHFAGRSKGQEERVMDCIDCGDEIAPARLKALPNAVRCLDCQEIKERKERHGE